MLKFLICAPEHTGTTLIYDLFRQVPISIPASDAEYFCATARRNSGILSLFFQHEGWPGLADADLGGCCDASEFPDFYAPLMAASTTISSDTRAILDMTPRYLSELTSVLSLRDLRDGPRCDPAQDQWQMRKVMVLSRPRRLAKMAHPRPGQGAYPPRRKPL